MKAVFLTQTHNSANTIRRCIESVLNQTHGDVEYHIFDNASVDGTQEILREYGARDSRVIPYFRSENLHWHMISYLPEIVNRYHPADWFVSLDSDDAYEIGFLEKMLLFAREYELDMAACPSNFIDAASGKSTNRHTLTTNLFVSGEMFDSLLPEYFMYIRDSYGKITRISVLRNIDFTRIDRNIATGSVSIVCAEALRFSRKFAVLAERLHRYYVYPQSLERTGARFVTADIYRRYLHVIQDKCGQCSVGSTEFLLWKYFIALRAKAQIALKLKIEGGAILAIASTLLLDPLTVSMLASSNPHIALTEKVEFARQILTWVDGAGNAVTETKEYGDFLARANGALTAAV